eukprot:scaffold188433_cov21-Tisochrysis_lutea.AAC.1
MKCTACRWCRWDDCSHGFDKVQGLDMVQMSKEVEFDENDCYDNGCSFGGCDKGTSAKGPLSKCLNSSPFIKGEESMNPMNDLYGLRGLASKVNAFGWERTRGRGYLAVELMSKLLLPWTHLLSEAPSSEGYGVFQEVPQNKAGLLTPCTCCPQLCFGQQITHNYQSANTCHHFS